MSDPKETPAAGVDVAAGAEETAGEARPGGSGGDPRQTEAPPRIGEVSSLDQVPVVADYLKRIGAEPVNPWRAAVRETVNGYPRTIGHVIFDALGIASISGGADAPTDAEREAIRAAFERVNLPTLVTLSAIGEPPPGCNLSDPMVFICHGFDGRIVAVRQRYEKPSGKGFLTWTRWSDGRWHNMEPDVLPFFGLPGHQDHSTLFLHEGEKSAARVKRILKGEEPGARFPWADAMRWGHHVGWIGGIHAIDRSDWTTLAAAGWKRVVIVADNDFDGKGLRAARAISKRFECEVFILAFDRRFGDAFDLGDPWPKGLFDSNGTHIGPSAAECMIPATWATTILPAEGRGRPTAVLRDEFRATVACTLDPIRFIALHQPSRDRSAEEFNALVAPFSDVKDTATKVLAAIECQHDRMIYDPGEETGTIHKKDGQRSFNVHQPSMLRPMDGDPAPWLDYMAHLVPDPGEREMVLRWIATLIAKPSIRMRYGLLLISTMQGVGKNTLGVVLEKMLGRDNVSFPSQREVVDSQFNGWISRKRLAFVSELYSGHSRKAYDELKDKITDTQVTVNEKFIKGYRIENWVHVIACSNSEAALHIDDEDRRWLVPAVAEAKQSPEWWDDLYAWLEGVGPGIILHWARLFVAGGNHVRTGDHAPDSKRKKIIAEGSRSEGQKLAIALAEHLVGLDRQAIIRVSEARKWIALQRGFRREGEPDVGDRRLEKDATILAAIKKVQGITVWADALRPKFGATREAVIMNFMPDAEVRWPEIKHLLVKREEIGLDETI